VLVRQGVEATLFATLMSILNGGAFTGSALGSGLTAMFGVTATDFKLLAPLILVRVGECTEYSVVIHALLPFSHKLSPTGLFECPISRL
jgi:hypothetical protein